jgi:hypothetical protein
MKNKWILLVCGLYSSICIGQITALGDKIVGHGDPVNYYIGHYPVPGSDGLDLHWYGGIRFGDYTGNVMQITDGKLGIGTATPISKLSVSGSISLSSGLSNISTRPSIIANTLSSGEVRAYSGDNYLADDGFIRMSAGGGTNAGVKSYIDLSGYSTIPDMDKNIVIGTSGIERMRIDRNGNIGIGTATPIEKLNVNGGIGDGFGFDTKIALTRTSSTGNVEAAKIVLDDADTNFGDLIFKVKTTASRDEIEGFYTNALTIKGANAFVGIGTTTPDAKLAVNGTIHAREVKVDLAGWPDYVFEKYYTGAANTSRSRAIYQRKPPLAQCAFGKRSKRKRLAIGRNVEYYASKNRRIDAVCD